MNIGRSGTSKENGQCFAPCFSRYPPVAILALQPKPILTANGILRFGDYTCQIMSTKETLLKKNLWVAESFQSLFDPLLSLWVIVLGSKDSSWMKFR